MIAAERIELILHCGLGEITFEELTELCAVYRERLECDAAGAGSTAPELPPYYSIDPPPASQDGRVYRLEFDSRMVFTGTRAELVAMAWARFRAECPTWAALLK